jgi:4-carboxymuconolactone decarboxylase
MSTAGSHARIAPLEPPYSPTVADALERWMGSNAAEPLRLFRTLMRNEELASRMRPLGAGILGPSARVPAPLREVMIQRTCALCGADYEWGVHAVAFGPRVGLGEEQLWSTVHGSFADACWDAEQALVFRLADELHREGSVSDECWDGLARAFTEEQLLELIVTAGWYHVISYLCNALRVQGEEWAAPMPAPGSQRT